MGRAFYCDRCGEMSEGASFSSLTMSEKEGFDKAELCFECSRELRDWFNDGGDEQ